MSFTPGSPLEVPVGAVFPERGVPVGGPWTAGDAPGPGARSAALRPRVPGARAARTPDVHPRGEAGLELLRVVAAPTYPGRARSGWARNAQHPAHARDQPPRCGCWPPRGPAPSGHNWSIGRGPGPVVPPVDGPDAQHRPAGRARSTCVTGLPVQPHLQRPEHPHREGRRASRTSGSASAAARPRPGAEGAGQRRVRARPAGWRGEPASTAAVVRATARSGAGRAAAPARSRCPRARSARTPTGARRPTGTDPLDERDDPAARRRRARNRDLAVPGMTTRTCRDRRPRRAGNDSPPAWVLRRGQTVWPAPDSWARRASEASGIATQVGRFRVS